MPVLRDLVAALSSGAVEVVDLTAPLSETTPILMLPQPFGQTATFQLQQISRYDDRGPAWYWNNVRTGEHTGTHLDAPIHWVTGRDKDDVCQIPAAPLVAPAVVLDFSEQAAADPDWMLELNDIKSWESEPGTTRRRAVASSRRERRRSVRQCRRVRDGGFAIGHPSKRSRCSSATTASWPAVRVSSRNSVGSSRCRSCCLPTSAPRT